MNKLYSVYTYVDVETDQGDAEIEYRLDYEWTPIRSRLYGPPEDCFPEEGGAEPIALYRDGREVDMDSGEYDELVLDLIEQADIAGDGSEGD